MVRITARAGLHEVVVAFELRTQPAGQRLRLVLHHLLRRQKQQAVPETVVCRLDIRLEEGMSSDRLLCCVDTVLGVQPGACDAQEEHDEQEDAEAHERDGGVLGVGRSDVVGHQRLHKGVADGVNQRRDIYLGRLALVVVGKAGSTPISVALAVSLLQAAAVAM
eukprot:scaffold7033_cov257-Pinguiococcus_pyrenoidosus.AAC.17